MEWEEKIELVKKSNGANTPNKREDFLKWVIERIDQMDFQSWDMFFNGIELIDTLITEQKELHKIIYENTRKLQTESMRCALRMSYYDSLVENSLGVKNKS